MNKKCIPVLVFLVLLLLLLYWFWLTSSTVGIALPLASVKQAINIQSANNDTKKNNKNKPNTKYVLIWSHMGATKTLGYFRTGFELFAGCLVKNCFATADKDLLPIEEFDALLFCTTPRNTTMVLPEKRSPKQRYVFAASETPLTFPQASSAYILDDFYNWTMSYRLDSDLVRRHGHIVRAKLDYEMPSKEFVGNKTRSVAWFVSNCNSSCKREELGRELQKYIDVDIYGSCGNLTCPKSFDCYKMLEKKYWFYLSFENSYCKDYTTEKFFRILTKDVVPVVYGGGNYKKVAPPNSYINVEDFPSVEHLARYLKELSTDIDRYLEYFEWKNSYIVYQGGVKAMCDLCKKLNDPDEPDKVYRNITQWWFNEKRSQCKTGNELPSIVSNS